MMNEVVTSRGNARVKQLRAAFAGQARLASGLVAIEGEHLLEEAVKSQQALKTVFVSERREVPEFVPRGIEVVRLATDVFQSCVETQTPQGIAALLVPRVSSVEEMLGPGLTGAPLILIAVGLQDPGNLGTLVRSAEAFGATGVLTTIGTVNPWNQKALRASAGSIFRMPVAVATPEAMERLEQTGVQLVAALKEDASAVDASALEQVFQGPVALMIGNEGAGLGEDWVRMADWKVTIPCPGFVESLNAAVAGSILLWEVARRRRPKTGAS
jgi:TrmH family RNA methyltransferase